MTTSPGSPREPSAPGPQQAPDDLGEEGPAPLAWRLGLALAPFLLLALLLGLDRCGV